MLTNLRIQNFKRFGKVEIELGEAVVFIGPNDSGKTTALQALALWEVGLKKWIEKRSLEETPAKRPGVTINRQELTALPVPSAKYLWRDLHVRDVTRDEQERQVTNNVRIDIVVSGVTNGSKWDCGLEFDFANEESLYCRPLRLDESKNPPRMQIPPQATDVKLAFLPPMSGLADREFVKQRGEIEFLIGQGRTAEVLRNLCFNLFGSPDGAFKWHKLARYIQVLFGVQLDKPDLIRERSEIVMSYNTQAGINLDLSSSGRGLHQTLLLLSFMAANPGAVLLLDEPDAHLEILRQRQIYQILTDTAREYDSQIIAASHSEVILNEAADRDMVVAFVGSPHRIDDRGSQVLKSLRDIGFEQYYQAEQTGWVLYIEGSTDLAIVKAFAKKLDHPAQKALDRVFVCYVGNQPQRAREHFYGLREAKSDLAGFLIMDRVDKPLQPGQDLTEYMWKKREIENYLCQPETLYSYAESALTRQFPGPLFDENNITRSRDAMKQCITDIVPACCISIFIPQLRPLRLKARWK